MKWLHCALLDLGEITSLLDLKMSCPTAHWRSQPADPKTSTRVGDEDGDDNPSPSPKLRLSLTSRQLWGTTSTTTTHCFYLLARGQFSICLPFSICVSLSLSLFRIGGCSWWWWLNRWSEYGEVGVKVIYYAGWTRTIKTDWLKHKTRNQQAIEACNDQRILFNLMVKAERKH